MDALARLTLFAHIAAGTVALLAGPVAMLSRKGLLLHRRAGKIYFWSMAAVFVTAVVLSTVRPNPFLFAIAIFSFYLVASGYRALSHKQLHKGGPIARIDWLVLGCGALCGAALIAQGTSRLIAGNAFGTVSVAFGAVLAILIVRTARKFFDPKGHAKFWLVSHVLGMCAGYIATITAFVVVNVTFLPGWLIWLLPTAVGTPLIVATIVRIRRSPRVDNASALPTS